MTQSHRDETVYRFAAFAARGTITLRSDCVHNKTRTHLGWWEQTIPLTDLKPNYGTLTATPGIFVWACIFASIFVGMGVWGVWAIPQKFFSVILLAAGLILGRYLFKHRTSEWILFNAHDDGARLGYTRQGPDAERCDMFTGELVSAIRNARERQNNELHGSDRPADSCGTHSPPVAP